LAKKMVGEPIKPSKAAAVEEEEAVKRIARLAASYN
jgi:hypothetical protein